MALLWLPLIMCALLTCAFIACESAEDPPAIETYPQDQTVASGGIAVFVCTAVGNPNPQIEWRKNGKRVTTQRYAAIDMPNGSVLRIEPVRAGRDDATYECVAENGVGEPVRALADLVVLPEDSLPPGFPRFVKQPNMQGIEKGRSAILPCQAEGDPEPNIKWLKNMIPLDMTIPRYSLHQGSSLQISDAEEEDQGNYECMAENIHGSALSVMATLFVRVRRVPPYFSIRPENLYEVMPGSSLNITCVAVGSPMPFVKWRKGLMDITPDHTIPIGRNVLVLTDINESANYTCIAASKLGTLETTAQVVVQALPRPPTNVRISDVTATSVRLSWSYDIGSENIIYYVIQYKPKQANQEYSEISGITTMFYTVRDLSPYTEYEFYVIAVNGIGRGSPSTPVVATTGETEPGSAPRNVQARPLSSSTVVIQWDPPKEPNGQVTGYKVYYTTRPNLPTSAWNTQPVDNNQLTTISDLTPQTIYTIRIQAFTSRGPGPHSAPVQVKTQQGVPSQPSNLRVLATSSTTVHVSWSKPSHSGEKVIGYDLYWNDTFTQQQYHQSLPDTDSFTLTDLYPDTLYYVWVAARSRQGEGAATPPAQVRTDQYVPGAPPQEVRGNAVNSRSLQVTWKPPPREQQNGAIIYYKIKYLKAEFGDDLVKAQEIRVEADQLSYIIGGLEKWTEYRVWVIAGTEVGDGPHSLPIILRTDEDVPGEPRQVKVAPINSTAITVRWKPPANKDRNGLIRGYQIHVQEVTNEGDLVNEPKRYDVADENAEEYNVTKLQPETLYAVQVAAVTRKGDGTRSRVKTVKTLGGVPTRPELTAQLIQEEPNLVAQIQWSRPTNIYGQLVNYKLRYGRADTQQMEERTINPLDQVHQIPNLDRGPVMNFIYLAKIMLVGVKRLIHILIHPKEFQLHHRKICHVVYKVPLFHKSSDGSVMERNTTETRMVFSNLDENTEYTFQVNAFTKKGAGPWSPRMTVQTPGDVPPAPTNVQAVATSDQSVEVWWDPVPYFLDILGYEISYGAHKEFYDTMAAPKPMVKPDSFGVKNGWEITVILPKASEEYGPISHYFLVVVPTEEATKDPGEFTIDESLYTSSPFSDPLSLDMTPIRGPTPAIDPGIRDRNDLPDMSQINSDTDKAQIIWIVGPVIALILITFFVIAVFLMKRRQCYRNFPHLYRRRQMAKTPGGETTMKLLMTTAERELPTHPTDPVEIRRMNYQTPAMINHPPIPITELANHIEMLKANDNLKFSQEYESIEPGQQFTWENSNLEINKPKNRYANVIAYDHSRVVLQSLDAIPGSDYINANYCDGYRKQNAYIATQGPLPETFGDFWRMVWEQRSATIVMMTKLEERTRIKCDQYWPTRGTETYGVMQVTLSDVQEVATYCIRTIHIMRLNQGVTEQREVRQFQFTAWPDHGVPDHPTPFLMFLRRVRSMNPPESGPMIVHCSAGVGRTGCFVVIDSMLERLKHESTVDIYGHVTCLRAQRNYMVQTEDQYVFIHDAVLEAVIAGNTEVPARNLFAHIQQLMQVTPVEGCTGMELEFKKLANMKTQSSKFVSANLPVNKFKNRLMNILPYESTRVCLQPIRGVDGSDYINASFIDGYKYRNAYIATQGPLPETTEDFWRMLWEHNSNIVVMLTKLKEMGREKCHQYWPNERSQRYLYYVVDPITEYNMPQYILREFKVTDARDGQSRTIRQFHFTDWPEQGVPKSGDGFIEFIGQVHKTKEQFGQEGPITVHCSAGVGRSGVFITLSIVLERMQYEGVVDVFQTVRTLRTQRPGMVQTEDQYQFCYRASLEYLGSFDHYTN
ncbi:Receptor-type tyrosine-protein phosphatase like protein [Argiope bruennichi]|uniref:protein-tyrosine-phosphatase n=1 Tax=Argiope bruennichi TaxID=94029 RepID=A0A8T0F6W9_ARGBR|nr:Receptor-type tyrosine-protein phosphatase like protein [Argiope bruennichi]